MLRVIPTPTWANDILMQLETVRFLRMDKGGIHAVTPELHKRLWTEARLAFAKIPGQSAHRWDVLVGLPTEEDITRALEYRPRSSMRYPGEEIYPTSGWIGTYLRWCQDGEVPLCYHFWAAVVAMSAACHRNVFMDRGSFYLYPCHSVFFVGPSGLRKTQAITTANSVIEAMNRQISQEWRENIRTQPHVLYDTDPRIRQMPHDASFLAIIKTLKGPRTVMVEDDPLTLDQDLDSCAILALEELGTLLSKDGFAVNKSIDTLIALSDAPSTYRYHTERQGPLELRNVALCLVAGTTPNWIRENLTTKMFLGGLASRILFIYRQNAGGRVYDTPEPLDPVAREELARWLAQVAGLTKTPMRLSPEARVRLKEWYAINHRHVEGEGVDEKLCGYYRRKDGHVLRLAMILALSNNELPEISLQRFEEALALLNFEETTMLDCFSEVGRHPDAPVLNVILNVVRRTEPISHSDLMRRTHHLEGVGRRFRELVESLVAMQRLDKFTINGSRSTYYRVAQDRMTPIEEATPQDLGTPEG
jgi:hypothetical protein